MKVLQVNTVCGYGSTGRIAVNIGNYVTKQGQQCQIAFGRSNETPLYDDTYYIGNSLDHYLHGLLSRITDRQGFYSHIPTYNFIKHIKTYKPDIIHLHNIHGYYLNIHILFNFLRETNIPIVWTFHDCWPFTGHCTYFDMVRCKKWQTGCICCPAKRDYPTSYFMDQSWKNYEEKKELFSSLKKLYIVTPSCWLMNLVAKSFLGNQNIRVINNGIDTKVFRPIKTDVRDRYGIDNNKIVLLGVASLWGKRKGYLDFLKLANCIEENTIIVMVGLNDAQLKELPKNIVGIKRTNSIKELCEIYSTADYFLNLTYEDNFPTTNIEALACGTPVITYDTGGSVECITEKCGVIIEKGDYLKVLEIIENSHFKKEDCLERAHQYRTEDRIKDYYKLYTEIYNV